MTKEKLLQIIGNEDECLWVEYKTGFLARKFYREIGEYISALSNSAALCHHEYAYLIWGIENKTRRVVGTNFRHDIDLENGEVFKHYLSRNLEPRLNYRFEEFEIKGKRIVVLIIPAANEVVTEFDHIRYIRLGSSKERLSTNPRIESELWVHLSGMDDITRIPSKKQNLTFHILKNYLMSRKYHINESNFENNLNLKTEDGKYNLMAEMLADTNDIVINVSIFASKDKSEYVKRDEFGGRCLLYSLERAKDYVEASFNATYIKLGEGRRKEKKRFDDEAFEQAWFNACVHNRWDKSNNPCIYVYEDRIEIESYGGIPRSLTLNEFLSGTSRPVNDKLFKIFRICGFGEESGHGVPSVISMYGEDAYKFSENFIRVAIPFNDEGFNQETTKKSDAKTTKKDGTKSTKKIVANSGVKNTDLIENLRDDTNRKTTKKTDAKTTKKIEVKSTKKTERNLKKEHLLNRLCDLLESNPELSRRDLVIILRLSDEKIKYYIEQLKIEGRIIRINGKKGGYWQVNRKK